MPACTLCGNAYVNQAIRQKKNNKKHLDWKGRSKILLADDVILHIENSKKLPKLTHEFSKIAQKLMNRQNQFYFYTLETNNTNAN
jgi:hypothetical protein